MMFDEKKQKGLIIALCALLFGAGSTWYFNRDNSRLPEDTLTVTQVESKDRSVNTTEKLIRKDRPTKTKIVKKPIVRRTREPADRTRIDRKPRNPKNTEKITKKKYTPAG